MVKENAVFVYPQVHPRVGAVGALAELHVDKPCFMGEPLIFEFFRYSFYV